MTRQQLAAIAATIALSAPLAWAQQPSSGSRQQTGTTDMQTRMEERQPSQAVAGQRPVELALVTSAGRISAMPAQFYGVPVSVHGRVARADNPHLFTIEEDAWYGFGPDLAVLVPSPAAGRTPGAGSYVTVVGTVHPFVAAEFERDYDWFDLDAMADIEVELRDRPVLVADVARTSTGTILTMPDDTATRVLIASAGDIADVPGRFWGRTVSVAAEVEDVWSPRAFTLDEDEWFAGPDVLVFNPHPVVNGAGDIEDEHVRVLGHVRPFIQAEFEAEYDWFDAADYDAFGLDQLEWRPVIVASSVIGETNRELVELRPDVIVDVVDVELAPRVEAWSRMAESRAAGRETRGTTGRTGEPSEP